MRDEPASNQQPNGQQHRNDGQPIPTRPPKCQQKAHAENDTRDFTRGDVEPGEDQQRPDNRRPQVSRRQGDCGHAALHVGDAALVGVERDGFHAPACAAGCYRMAEFVEGDHEHLWRAGGGVSTFGGKRGSIGAKLHSCIAHLEGP